MAMFDMPKRFSRQWVQRKVPQMDSTEFHAVFHECRDSRLGRGRVAAVGSDVGGGEQLLGTPPDETTGWRVTLARFGDQPFVFGLTG
jgi:hypothetical protein